MIATRTVARPSASRASAGPVLAELEQVAVRIAQEAAGLAAVDDGRCQEDAATGAEELIGGLAILDPDREEVVAPVRIGRWGEGHARLVERRPAALDEQEPRPAEGKNDRGAVLAVERRAQDIEVPGARPGRVADDEDVRQGGVGGRKLCDRRLAPIGIDGLNVDELDSSAAYERVTCCRIASMSASACCRSFSFGSW